MSRVDCQWFEGLAFPSPFLLLPGLWWSDVVCSMEAYPSVSDVNLTSWCYEELSYHLYDHVPQLQLYYEAYLLL